MASCAADESAHQSQLTDQILDLDTADKKSEYLAAILRDDQMVRSEDDGAIILTHGQDSPEYQEYITTQKEMDKRNLDKVEAYLSVHGYPSRELGSEANRAPWLVIHHAQGYAARERNFPLLYQTYLDGQLDEGALAFYLGRMHHMKYGKMLRMDGAFTAENQIDTLIELLSLPQFAQ